MEKVVVGMSGGIDSTLTAAKLQESGYHVVGVTLHMWDHPSSERAIADARRQALALGVEHHVVDCRADFAQRIVAPFVASYLAGRTPSPCASCNPQVKWWHIARFADSVGARLISSGHYIEVAQHGGHHYITKGGDPVKDQSYYLWMLPESIIQRMVQPLGGITKEQTRQEIREKSLEDIVPTRESMSVCFLAGQNYRDFLFEQAPEAMKQVQPGTVLDEAGLPIGHHNGLPFYTVGQKRDLLLDTPREAYVQVMDAQTNTITVAKKAGLLQTRFAIEQLHFVNRDEITPDTPLEVKVRGLGLNPEGYGFIRFEGSQGHVTLQHPAWAVAGGQPAVFYLGNRLVGGGIIV